MKHQYVGDINDYRKYALLRALSAGGVNRIGVCWMLTADDRGSDGNKLAYLGQANRFRHFDPGLFDVLTQVASAPSRRRLDAIEESGVIPGASYYNADLSDGADARRLYMADCLRELSGADLIFFDPDNGLEVSLRRGRKNSSKYLYLDEAAAFYAAGKSLLIYQHFPHIERKAFIRTCLRRLSEATGASAFWTFTSAHVVFLLALHPESPSALSERLADLGHSWTSDFIRAEQAPAISLGSSE